MYKDIKRITRDTLHVSKITRTNNKKIIILFSVLLSQLIAGADILIILFFTSLLTDNITEVTSIELFNTILGFQFLLPFLIVFRYTFQYSQSIVLKKMELDVQNNLKSYLLSEVFDKRNYSVADAYFYINTLSAHISYFYSSIAHFLNFLLQTIAFSIYLFMTEPKTIGAFILGIIFLVYPLSYLIKKAREYMHKSYELGQDASHEIQKVVDNMFIIKLLNKEQDEIRRFKNTITEFNLSVLNNHKFSVLNSYLPSFITIFLLSIIILFFNSIFKITLPFVGVTLRMFQSLGQLAGSLNQIINSHVHIEQFYEMQKSKPEINKENYIYIENQESPFALNFDNVSFKYINSEDEIFSGFDLKIKKGSHTIITGQNGSGKSTLLGLMAGVFYPTNGKVTTCTNKVGFVGPTPLIFSTSLRENITYGNKDPVSDEKILKIIKEFQLFSGKSAIDLNTKIDNKSLSSGQMQKIAFIRALLSDIDTLFLDESTANLDESSKELIFSILEKRNLTIINSTHEIHNFKKYDKHINIIFKDDSRIIKNVK